MTYSPQPPPDGPLPGAQPHYPAYPPPAVPGYGQQQAYPPPQTGQSYPPPGYPPQGQLYPPPGYPPTNGQSGYLPHYPGYAPQGQYPQPPYPNYPQVQPQPVRVTNQRANLALIDGCLSIVFSLITFYNQYGIAGVFTGTFAIIYGVMGLNIAQRLPNKAGQVQAIIAIILGTISDALVVITLVIQSQPH
jgi:hypothetical protein